MRVVCSFDLFENLMVTKTDSEQSPPQSDSSEIILTLFSKFFSSKNFCVECRWECFFLVIN